MVFSRAYCAVAMCAPFRQELYSGRTPWRTGTLPNHSKSKPNTRSIAHYMKEVGYRVALAGKSHIGPKEAYPFEMLGDVPKKSDGNPAMMKKMRDFITSTKGGPFCLFLASHDAHGPYTTGDPSQYPPDKLKVPPYWYDTPEFRRAFSKYLAEVTNFDVLVGQVYAELKGRGILDDTILVVCSEQGSAFPYAKWTCFDNGLHCGLIARYPDFIRPGSECGELVAMMDVTPTLVELAGGTLKDGECDGTSFAHLLRGETGPIHEYVYGAFTNCNIIDNRKRVYPIRSIRDKEYTLMYCPNNKDITSNTSLSGALELVQKDSVEGGNGVAASWARKRKEDRRAAFLTDRFFSHPEYELYKLADDPCEENNLIDDPAHKSVAERMKKALHARLEQLGDSDPIRTEQSLVKKQ
jgi:uncharacterized sulfatase